MKIRPIANYLIKAIDSKVESKFAWLQYANALLRIRKPDPWLADAKDIHKGERCFILATGPSLNKVELDKLKGEVCFGVNGTYMLDNVDLTYFAIVSNWYWREHREGIKNVRCTRRFIPDDTKELDSSVPTSWYRVVRPKYNARLRGPLPVPAIFSFHPQHVLFAGGTVLFICMQLAYYMGFETVVLLGVDHSYRPNEDKLAKRHQGYMLKLGERDQEHFRPDYNPANIEYHVDLNAMERGYWLADIAFRKDKRQILNASPGTKLDIFPKVNYNALF